MKSLAQPTGGLRPPLAALLALACLAFCGCDEELETRHGVRATTTNGISVNGTAVLANMFEQAGHNVYTRRALTPTLAERAQTIVWAPDAFTCPKGDVIQWFNQWLADDPDRTLIYIGRDFDAAPHYWDAVIPSAPVASAPEFRRRLNESRLARVAQRGKPDDESCEWFELNYSESQRDVQSLSGPWGVGVDAKKARIELEGRIEPNPIDEPEILLEDPSDPLAWRIRPVADGGQLIVVANGSFLLNYPLLNHEHRKLAAQLVSEVDPKGRVVFVESDESGLPISEDPAHTIPSALTMFTVWPINVLLLHLAALGVVLCVCWWPIFGRPRSPPRSDASDFGKHVVALGEMLELTGDHSYATIRVLQYQQAQRGEAPPASTVHGATGRPSTSSAPANQPLTGTSSAESYPGAPPVAATAARRGTPPVREKL